MQDKNERLEYLFIVYQRESGRTFSSEYFNISVEDAEKKVNNKPEGCTQIIITPPHVKLIVNA